VEGVAAVTGGALGQPLELGVRRELRPPVRLATQHVRRSRRPSGARRWRRIAARAAAVGGGVDVALLAPTRRRHTTRSRIAALHGLQQQLQLRVGKLRKQLRLQRILVGCVEFARLQQALRQMSAFAAEHEHERAAQRSTIGGRRALPVTWAALRRVNAASCGAPWHACFQLVACVASAHTRTLAARYSTFCL